MTGESMQALGAPAYRSSLDDALARLGATRDGLTTQEAISRAARSGPNTIVSLKKEGALRRYLRQYTDPLVLLLVAAGVVTFFLNDHRTPAVLAVLVAINTLIGYGQEERAIHTMKALERLVTPTADVRRDGRWVQLESAGLVAGDIVRLSEGAFLPATCASSNPGR